MGGEKSQFTEEQLQALGSPPHGRGKGVCPYLLSFGHGITPAWAGKSASYSISDELKEDHPRMGGEKPLPCVG